MVSDVVTTVVEEARGLTREISDSVADHGRESVDGKVLATTVDTRRRSEIEPDGDPAVTKKELYEEAREADIEGRSSMTKAQLQEALNESED